MTLRVLPIVGSKGFYELATPFDALAVDTVEYTCKAIRRISDCIANSEDIKTVIYDANKIDENIYDEDLAEDAYIVSLQSGTGHWLYVPYRYILSYPSPNGVPYRSVMFGVSLPSIPASQELNALLLDVKALVEARLGVTVAVRLTETSKVSLIPIDTHIAKQNERETKKMGENSYFAASVRLRRENDLLIEKVSALEQFIKINHT